jgi:hypothetical protein
MYERVINKRRALTFATIACGLGLLAFAGSGTAAAPSCGSFASQADGQDAFFAHGGSPRHPVGELDPDRDGIACEGLPGPYKGYATIGYNRKRQFFYGVAKMPVGRDGTGFACMYGNPRSSDIPRSIVVFKVTRHGDKPILAEFKDKAEARPDTGRLLWKVERSHPPFGRYYVAFAPRVPFSPHGRNKCPGFDSQPTLLPPPRR